MSTATIDLPTAPLKPLWYENVAEVGGTVYRIPVYRYRPDDCSRCGKGIIRVNNDVDGDGDIVCGECYHGSPLAASMGIGASGVGTAIQFDTSGLDENLSDADTEIQDTLRELS